MKYNRIEFDYMRLNWNLPLIGCVGISAPLIPCVSNKFLTFEQLLSGFAAAASAPCTSFGVVDDRAARFCAAAIVNACNENNTMTARWVYCRAVSSVFDRFLLDHIVAGCIFFLLLLIFRLAYMYISLSLCVDVIVFNVAIFYALWLSIPCAINIIAIILFLF